MASRFDPLLNKTDRCHDPRLVKALTVVSIVGPIIAVLVIALAIASQLSHAPLLSSLAPKIGGTSVSTAVSVGCITLGLLLRKKLTPSLAYSLAAVPAVLSCTAFASHAIFGADVLSPAVASWIWGPGALVHSKTSVLSALCALTLSAAQIARVAGRHPAVDTFSGVAMLLSGAALLAYAYGVPDLHHIFFFSTITFYTALGFFLLAVSTIVSEPQQGWVGIVVSSRSGGGPTRRQLAFSILPIGIAAWLLGAVRSHELSVEAAITFLVLLTLVPLIALIVRDGATLNARDMAEENVAAFRQKIEAELQAELASQARALNREHQERLVAESALFRTQRMEAIGQLTGGIAHDFNNLLMATSNLLHLMRRQIPSDHPSSGHLSQLASVTERGASLTKQLLVFSRTQLLDIRAIEVRAALTSARALIGNALGPAVNITVELPEHDVWINSDLDQLQLAILNLALNSRDAMNAGGTLRIAASLISHSTGDTIRIRVSDSGAGMPAEIVARATEPFFTTKAVGKGTGLGLAQVYGFVQQCKGELLIQSEVGKGTDIDLVFRRVAADTGSSDPILLEPTSKEETGLPQSVELLLVDDDEHVRAAMAELLRCSGYIVSEASNGQIALDILDRLQPSLAIIDYLMPGMNGVEVAREARKRQPHLPIVFVSGYSDTAALESIERTTVFRKPISPDILVDAIEMMTSSAKATPYEVH